LVSFFILLILFSLAGIPPLVGFYAKFLVLKGLVDLTFYYIMIAALLFSVIGSFYYLRVIKVMFFDTSVNFSFSSGGNISLFGTFVLYLNSIVLLLFGFYPYPILSLCKTLLVSSSKMLIF
jgi:NADH-quinone oxidoreductase subunit N